MFKNHKNIKNRLSQTDNGLNKYAQSHYIDLRVNVIHVYLIFNHSPRTIDIVSKKNTDEKRIKPIPWTLNFCVFLMYWMCPIQLININNLQEMEDWDNYILLGPYKIDFLTEKEKQSFNALLTVLTKTRTSNITSAPKRVCNLPNLRGEQDAHFSPQFKKELPTTSTWHFSFSIF